MLGIGGINYFSHLFIPIKIQNLYNFSSFIELLEHSLDKIKQKYLK